MCKGELPKQRRPACGAREAATAEACEEEKEACGRGAVGEGIRACVRVVRPRLPITCRFARFAKQETSRVALLAAH